MRTAVTSTRTNTRTTTRRTRLTLAEATGIDLAYRLGGPVDAVGAADRAANLAKRSLKKEAKVWGLEMALRCCDLTTLEGSDSDGKVRQLAAKAMRPDPLDASVPHVAALCVYPRLVPVAAEALAESEVFVASVATAFPSGQSLLDQRLDEIDQAVLAGADEIDMVISRGAFLAGDDDAVFEEIELSKEASGDAHLKVILETGELGSLEMVRHASLIAMAAGADFVKTSTGKIAPAATFPVAVVMAEAIRDYHDATGIKVGLKVAGGIRTSKDALRYLVLVNETLGPAWLTPDLFRIGASSVVNDLLMQLAKQSTGTYADADRFSLD